MSVALSLYCTGRSGWDGYQDAQLWASGGIHEDLIPGWEHMSTLQPMYGSVAGLYRVTLIIMPDAEPGWVSARASLIMNGNCMGSDCNVPLSWYVGCPTDWPSGLARFPEVCGEDNRSGFRKVWTLAVRRSR